MRGVASPPVASACRTQALVEERAEAIERVELDRRRPRRARSATASTASTEQPANTDSSSNSRCSAGLEELVAPFDRRAQRLLALRQVARRRRRGASGGSRAGPAAPRARTGSCARSRARSRAAGRRAGGRSRRRRRALSSVRRKSDRTARARSTKSWIASNWLSSTAVVAPVAAGGQRQRRHGDDVLAADAEGLAARDEQLQARAVGAGARASIGAGDGDLLEVVEDEQDVLRAEVPPELVERRPLGRVAEADGASRPAPGRASLSVAVIRSTKKTPSVNRSIWSAAARSASRVLPVPPGPVSVTSRTSASSRRSRIACELARRGRRTPDAAVGRLFGRRSRVASGGNSAGRPGRTSWKRRSGRPRSFSRCSPRSRSVRRRGRPLVERARRSTPTAGPGRRGRPP